MGRWSDIAKVKTNQGGLYFLPGDYVVDIKETKLITNRRGIDCFIVSAKVVTSTCPEREVGCEPSQVIQLRRDILETAMANIKQFVASCVGLDNPDEYLPEQEPGESEDEAKARWWEETMDEVVEGNPFQGIRIRLNVTQIKTREGNDFSKHVWGPTVEGE